MSPGEDLRKAARRGNITQIRTILTENPSLVNFTGDSGRTPLILAIMANQIEAAKVLINEFHADQTIKDKDGETAYNHAVRSNRKDIEPFLTYRNENLGTIKQAISSNNLTNLDLLLDIDENIAKLNEIDPQGYTLLMYAVESNNYQVVERLVQKSVDQSIKNKCGQTAYDMASLQIKKLLDPKYSSTQLHKDVIKEGNASKLDELIKQNPGMVNEQDENGLTLLMHAINSNNEDCVKVILSYQPSQSIRNENGLTAYDLASDQFKPLLEEKFSTKDLIRKYIIDGNETQLDELLQNNKEFVDYQEPYLGITPLIFAVLQNQLPCVNILLKHDAKQFIKDKMGHTAYDRAVDERIRDILLPIYSTEYVKDFELAEKIGRFKAKNYHILIDTERTQTSTAFIIFGSFIEFNKRTKVVIKKKQSRRNLSSEAKILRDFQINGNSDEMHLLKYYDIHGQIENPDYIVLEDFGSDLTSFYHYDVEIRKVFIIQILHCVRAIHKLQYMHGDIKPENILVSSNYKCKLCDFDNAKKVVKSSEGLFPRTTEGILRFSEAWVSPEVYIAYLQEKNEKNKKIDIYASFEIDIYSTALVIDLLCCQIISPSKIHEYPTNLQNYISNPQFLSIISYCVKFHHPYGKFIEEMLSISPNHRKDIAYYLEAIKTSNATGLYRQVTQTQKELENANQLKNFLLQQIDNLNQDKLTSSQLSLFENKLAVLFNTLSNIQGEMKEIVTETNNLRNVILKVRDEIIDDQNHTISNALDQINNRSKLIEQQDTSSFDGNFQANLINQLNLKLLETLETLETIKTNQNVNEKYLSEIKQSINLQKEQINNLAKDVQELTISGNNFHIKLDELVNLTLTSDNLKEIMNSSTTRPELELFCNQYNNYIESTIKQTIVELTQQITGENNQVLENITESLRTIENISNELKNNSNNNNNNNNENFESLKNFISQSMTELDEKIKEQGSIINDTLNIIRGVIITNLDKKIDDNQDSMNKILTEVQKITNNDNLSEELKEFIKNTTDSLRAIRNFQNLSVYNAHEHPVLFIIIPEEKKNNSFAKFVGSVQDLAGKNYRMSFFCSICGKIAHSGKHKNKKDQKNMLNKISDILSVSIENQGGYELFLPDATFQKTLIGLKWILRLVEIATKLAGLPFPNVSQFLKVLPENVKIEKHLEKYSKKMFNQFDNFVKSELDDTKGSPKMPKATRDIFSNNDDKFDIDIDIDDKFDINSTHKEIAKNLKTNNLIINNDNDIKINSDINVNSDNISITKSMNRPLPNQLMESFDNDNEDEAGGSENDNDDLSLNGSDNDHNDNHNNYNDHNSYNGDNDSHYVDNYTNEETKSAVTTNTTSSTDNNVSAQVVRGVDVRKSMKSFESYTDEEREKAKKYWQDHRPKITNTIVKLVKEILVLVGDPDAKYTGLRRSINEDEGSVTWVCEETSTRGNDNETNHDNEGEKLTCHQLFQKEGSKCCLVHINYS